jgi:Secretion system C-terminal sorting domain
LGYTCQDKTYQMKTFTLFIAMTFLLATTSQSQTTYTVSSSRTWQNGGSSAYPSNCANCTFNIASGATLTIDKDVTCQNCTFNGGIINMTSFTLTLQTNSSKNTYFTNTRFLVYGSSLIKGSAPIYITNSTFIFYGTSQFNSQKILELSNSRLNFYGSSYMNATGGPVNLKNNSSFVAGDGTLASTGYIYINGPQLNLYDISTVVMANRNNYYFNWNDYYSASNNKSYSTKVNAMNCGSGYPHACSMPYLYGTASLTSGGVLNINYLPVTLTDFTTRLLTNHTVAITWSTQQETNSAYFSIERSVDGTQWVPVGTVTAKGNSGNVSKYAFTDVHPAEGMAYYRLRMVDLDNSYMLSEIKSVKSTTIQNISVCPNPTHDFVNVTVTSDAKKIRLMQATGQVLQERTLTGNSTVVSLPVQQYTTGTYMVQVMNTNGSVENKIVVISK